MESKRFMAVLESPGTAGLWTYLTVRWQSEPTSAGPGRVPVKGTINGVCFRSWLLSRGDGSHFLVVGSEIQRAAGICPGDIVEAELEMDPGIRAITVPDDLQEALLAHPQASAALQRLSHSLRRAYVSWVDDARIPETRVQRIQKVLEFLA